MYWLERYVYVRVMEKFTSYLEGFHENSAENKFISKFSITLNSI